MVTTVLCLALGRLSVRHLGKVKGGRDCLESS